MPRRTATSPVPLLIVVHPGSACGSADMNLGRSMADEQRLEMQELVEGWEGAVAVIDGELSDELLPGAGRDVWRDWGIALEEALERARKAGCLAIRVQGDDGDDFDQRAATRQLVAKYRWGRDLPITLTGAWVDGSGDGCVHSVREVLEELGFSPRVEDAMDLDYPEESQDDDCNMEAEAPAPASRPRCFR